jgi:hypothetical protein
MLTEQLCWSCNTKCEWMASEKPIAGWIAEETDTCGWSYRIYECPKYSGINPKPIIEPTKKEQTRKIKRQVVEIIDGEKVKIFEEVDGKKIKVCKEVEKTETWFEGNCGACGSKIDSRKPVCQNCGISFYILGVKNE